MPSIKARNVDASYRLEYRFYMLIRWKSGKWEKKVIVKKQPILNDSTSDIENN